MRMRLGARQAEEGPKPEEEAVLCVYLCLS